MDCIEVTEGRKPDGYGRSSVWVGGREYRLLAHRVAFELAHGITLRAGQVVRHTCDNPSCVNPLHLQLGTQRNNVQDMMDRSRQGWQNRPRTQCVHGHLFTEANTYVRSDGTQQCRACKASRQRARMSRVRSREGKY